MDNYNFINSDVCCRQLLLLHVENAVSAEEMSDLDVKRTQIRFSSSKLNNAVKASNPSLFMFFRTSKIHLSCRRRRCKAVTKVLTQVQLLGLPGHLGTKGDT